MSEQAKHILNTFNNALSHLREEVLMMSSLAERNLNRAMQGLLERNDDLCNISIADDEEIDQLEKQVDKDGIELLLRFQPVASDLRQVVSAMKLSSNLERIADQAVNIARKARKLNRHPILDEVALLDPMYRQALVMFQDSLKAYVDGNVDLALSLKPRDKELDQLNAKIGKQLIDEMVKHPDQIRGYLNLTFIARHIERVGDHATNIAEDAVYAAAAEDIRHNHTTQ